MYYILYEGLNIESNEPVYCTLYTIQVCTLYFCIHCTLYSVYKNTTTHIGQAYKSLILTSGRPFEVNTTNTTTPTHVY